MPKGDEIKYDFTAMLPDEDKIPEFLAEKIKEGKAQGNIATVLVVFHKSYDEFAADMAGDGRVGVKLTSLGDDKDHIQEMTCLALGHALMTRMELGAVELRQNVVQLVHAWCIFVATKARDAFKKKEAEKN